MLMQVQGRRRLLGPPSTVAVPQLRRFAQLLAAQRVSPSGDRNVLWNGLGGGNRLGPFANYTGRSVGDPVGMFNRVPGFGRMFRG